MKKFCFLLFFSQMTITCFCQSTNLTFVVKVSSYSSKSTNQQESYLLIAGDSVRNIQQTLANKSHVDLLVKSLMEKEYFRMEDSIKEKPILFIEYDYTVSLPEKIKEKRYQPTYSPNTTVKTNVNVNSDESNVNFSKKSGAVLPQAIQNEPLDILSLNLPSGYTPIEFETIVYKRKLTIKCYSINKGEHNDIWVTEAESIGTSGDLREVVPAMIFAIKPYLGSNVRTPKEITVNIKSRAFQRFIE